MSDILGTPAVELIVLSLPASDCHALEALSKKWHMATGYLKFRVRDRDLNIYYEQVLLRQLGHQERSYNEQVLLRLMGRS